MRFAHPFLLLIAVPVGLAMLWLLLTRGTGGRPGAALLRCLSLALIVLALAQPQVGHGSGGPVALALDRSLSIGPAETHTERAWLKAADSEGCGADCAVVQFAGTSKLTASSIGLLSHGRLEPGQTDLRGALGLALARTPAGGRVVLLSDGLQTRGEASAAAAQARARRIRVDVVPLSDRRRDAAITRLAAPQALRAGDPFSLEFTIASTAAAEAKIQLKVNGGPAVPNPYTSRPAKRRLSSPSARPRPPARTPTKSRSRSPATKSPRTTRSPRPSGSRASRR